MDCHFLFQGIFLTPGSNVKSVPLTSPALADRFFFFHMYMCFIKIVMLNIIAEIVT